MQELRPEGKLVDRHPVSQFRPLFDGVIPSGAVFQAQGGISLENRL
jgi:hypothetical protein